MPRDDRNPPAAARRPFFALCAALLIALGAVNALGVGRPGPWGTPRPAHDRSALAAPDQATATPPAGDPGAAPGAAAMTVLGHHDLGGFGRNAGAWANHGIAYVGATCAVTVPGRTTKIVDVRDPTQPKLVGGVPWPSGSRAAEVKVQTVETPHFQGELLAATLEQCSAGGPMGAMLWDVTDPARPQSLATFTTTTGVHTLWLAPRRDRVLLLLALPGAERQQLESGGQVGGPEFRVVDVTNPRQPVQVGAWSLYEQLGLHPRGGYGSGPSNNLHELAASPDGNVAYLSWWDAGLILLDIHDPARPTLLSRTNYPSQEGNTHTAVSDETGGLLLVADEDFDPTATRLEVLAPAALAGTVDDAQGGQFSAEIMIRGGPVQGDVVYTGRGCPGWSLTPRGADDPYLADPSGKIALIDRGACTAADKLRRAQQAGARAVLMASDLPYPPGGVGVTAPMTDPVRIPIIQISKVRGDAFKAALAEGTALSVRMSGRGDQWGSAWMMDIRDPRSPVLLSQLTTTHTVQYPPYNAGVYTAHQPLLSHGRAYLAWYGDGLRVFDVAEPRRAREIGYFMPPQAPAASGAVPAPFSWGIGLDERAVYIADYATGLWIISRDIPGHPAPTPTPIHPTATATTEGPAGRAYLPRVVRGEEDGG